MPQSKIIMTEDQKHNVTNVRAGSLQTIIDDRGSVVIAEQGKHIDFAPERLFFVRPIRAGQERGGHAHIVCRQVLVCITGRCRVDIDDGLANRSYTMEGPDSTLSVPSGIWSVQTYETHGSSLMVLCDRPYNEKDYIRDYAKFLEFRGVGSGFCSSQAAHKRD